MKQQRVMIELRPSLRAAVGIVREFGNLHTALEEVQRFNIGAMAKVVWLASTDQSGYTDFLHDTNLHGIQYAQSCIPAFIKFFNDLLENPFGDEPKKPGIKQDKKPNQNLTQLQYYRQLFEAGTGVLGWTPAQTWAATIPEITMAYQSRTKFVNDILQSVFGSPDDQEKPEAIFYDDSELDQIIKDGKDPNFDQSGLADLKAML